MVEIRDGSGQVLIEVPGDVLHGADLHGANLHGAYLREADLNGAGLGEAGLGGADLRGADLGGANLPDYQISSGELDAWKKINGCIVQLLIRREWRRTGSLIGRKCRAERALVVGITGPEGSERQQITGGYANFTYRVGEVVEPDRYDDNPALECTHGIHFFLTREEAVNYQ